MSANVTTGVVAGKCQSISLGFFARRVIDVTHPPLPPNRSAESPRLPSDVESARLRRERQCARGSDLRTWANTYLRSRTCGFPRRAFPRGSRRDSPSVRRSRPVRLPPPAPLHALSRLPIVARRPAAHRLRLVQSGRDFLARGNFRWVKRHRPSPVVTFAVIALAPACSTTTSAIADGGADAEATDSAATDSCPGLHTSCAAGTDLACTTSSGYRDNRRCLGGVWCQASLNPPPPPAQPGDCPSAPPTDGTPCATMSALVDCVYACDGALAHAVCYGNAWCGVVAPTCTQVVDSGADAAADADAD